MSTEITRERESGAARTPASTNRDPTLAMDPARFRELGHELVDVIADFLAAIPTGPVTRNASPQQLASRLDPAAPLPATGAEPSALLREATSLLFEQSLLNGHPRFFGYITSSPAHLGMLGDFLASAVNANVGSWRLGPVATAIEAQTVRWIAELVGYPAECGGLLVSGGNMANMVGFLAARRAAADWEVRSGGLRGHGARQLRVYASLETHTWIQKAADLFGLGTDAIRWIPTDDAQRMDIRALREQLAVDRLAGDHPMMVVGTSGSVSTGAVDPLAEIAAICREHAVWFHVDGAYGAFAAAAKGVPADLAALHLADSVALDPHKWLYAPLEAGCALVRRPEHLRDAFSYHPPYYHFGVEALNYVDYGPQNSRGFRALKVWLALRQLGRDGYARMIGDDIRLAERLYHRCAAHPELHALTYALSIVTFRYVPPHLRDRIGEPNTESYLNRLNEALLERIQATGELFVSNAVIGGVYTLRACIVNFNTTASDVDAVPEIVARLGRETERDLAP